MNETHLEKFWWYVMDRYHKLGITFSRRPSSQWLSVKLCKLLKINCQKKKRKGGIWKPAICCFNLLNYFSVYLLFSVLREEMCGVETEEREKITCLPPEFHFLPVSFKIFCHFIQNTSCSRFQKIELRDKKSYKI